LGLAIDIEKCIDEYAKGLSDIVITVTDAHRSPYFNMVKTNTDGSYILVDSSFSGTNRRQDVPTVYDMATVCYVAKSEFVMSHNSIFEGRVGAVHVPIERAIDIDTLLDFQFAEYLLSQREQKNDHVK
jgi:N-acylneuraminate cytidylyltransferase